MATLELRRLRKSFGENEVVRDLDLRAEHGEFLVLVGPSGCGKSTILRLIAGLETPDGGDICIDGRPVIDLEPRERDVAMVFQSYALYPHMNARGNIAFPLRMARVPARERDQRVSEAARTLGIEETLDRRPDQLSGGQQQRVALARALVRRPRLFLFDEPLSNVDARLRTEMRAELKRLHRELRATMIYVTHDQVEAMTMGTRIAVLAEGRLQQVGAPLELYRRPANTFVAGFLGSPPMNLLRGDAARTLTGADDDAVIGFRAHDATPSGPLAARVVLIEELGNETLVHASCDDQQRFVLSRPAEARLEPGAELRVGVPVDRLHRFDPRTGERIG